MGAEQYQIIRKQTLAKRKHDIEEWKQKLKNRAKDLDITADLIDTLVKLPLQEIVRLLNNFQITSEKLVVVYAIRTLTVGVQLNLFTELNFQEALIMAVACDVQRQKSKKTNWIIGNKWDLDTYLPPLYGVPYTVKDLIDQRGKRTTAGLSARANIIKQQDADLVFCFRNAGMIPLVRTNVPQAGMMFQTVNNLWGRSLSNWSPSRTVGGSSGGESGMISAKCSPIGLGSDVGGSIRNPSEFCGLYGLKPSYLRLTTGPSSQTFYSKLHCGKSNINSLCGPIGRCTEDLVVWMITALEEKFYGNKLSPYFKMFPFQINTYQKTLNSKLKIGYFKNIKLIESSPASNRVIDELRIKLQRLGHQLIQVELPQVDNVVISFFNQVGAQGQAKAIMSLLQGEQPIKEYSKMLLSTKMSSVTYSLVRFFMNILQPRISKLMETSRRKTVYEYLLNAGFIHMTRSKTADYWRQKQLDLVVCPGFACPAPKHGFGKNIFLAAAYNMIGNVLGLAAGSVPISIVREDEQHYQSQHNDMITKAMKQNAKNSAGMPVGIQVIGLPYQEEKVLAGMKIIEGVVGKEVEEHRPFIRCTLDL